MWKKLSIYALFALVALLIYNALKDGVANILHSFNKAITPVILGGAFAYLLNHLVSFYKKLIMLTKLRRTGIINFLSVAGAIVTVVAVLSVLVIFSIPAVNRIINDGGIDGFINKIKSSFQDIDDLLGLNGDISLSKLTEGIDAKAINEYLEGFLVTLPSTLSTIGISLVIAVTLLFEKDALISTLKRIADGFTHPEKIKNGCGCAVVILDGYALAKIIEGGITGTVFGIGCAILGVPFSILLGVIMALFFTVPYVGGYFALIPAFLFSVTVSPVVGLIVLIFGIVLINVVGTFISPLLFKNKLKSTPLTTLVSTIVGGGIFGLWGFLLAPPVVAIVKVYISVFVKSRQIPQ